MPGPRLVAQRPCSPKAATLLWLEEAHQFGSLPAYVDWLIDQPISAAPLERVPMQARAAAVAALRGQPREVVREAAHQAIRDAVFLVELVLGLNSAATDTIRIEGLRYAVLFWELRAISAEAELARRNRSRADRSAASLVGRWQAWCAATVAFLSGLYAPRGRRPRALNRPDFGGDSILWRKMESWRRCGRGRADPGPLPDLRPSD